mgnify:CR=1 FL=1
MNCQSEVVIPVQSELATGGANWSFTLDGWWLAVVVVVIAFVVVVVVVVVVVFGDQNASVLAREWCGRLQYFWNVYQNSSDPHHVFSAEDIAAYRPLPEFTEVLAGLQGRALRRALELAALVPCERH